jgi:hypothetical protein
MDTPAREMLPIAEQQRRLMLAAEQLAERVRALRAKRTEAR